MKRPLVSILMRNYNEQHVIKKTLRMLSKQHYTNWELIAYDNGSTDGSAETLKNFKPIVFIENNNQKYYPGTVLNKMASVARGEIVVFNNADCVPVGRNWLENLIKPLLQYKNKNASLYNKPPVIVFAKQIGHKKMRISLQRDLHRAYGSGNEHSKWFHFFSLASSATFKHTVKQYPFLPNFLFCEDVEWSYRMRKKFNKKSPIVYCSNSVVLHNHNYSNLSLLMRTFGEGYWNSKIFPIYFSFSYFIKLIPSLIFHIISDYVFLFKNITSGKKIFFLLDPFIFRIISKSAYATGMLSQLLFKK